MDYTKKTAGQTILDHDQLGLELEDDVIEYRRKMEGKIMNQLRETAYATKNKAGYENKDFYVLLTITADRVLRQPKTIIWARRSCPTPVYKQAVWKYMTASDELVPLWSLPDQIMYYHILRNKAKFIYDKETSETAKYVILDHSGELLDWVKKENGEKIDAIIKIDNQENTCLMN